MSALWKPQFSFSSFFRLLSKRFLISEGYCSVSSFYQAAGLDVYAFVSCLCHKSAYVYCPLVGLTSVVLTGVIHQYVVGIPPDIMS